MISVVSDSAQELQRFPRLHAQLVEVVSELLRERLGPTSEYAQSLIAIQAAYINTNHPEFVAGSAAIARDGAGAQQQQPQAQTAESSHDDVSESGSDEAASAPPNGAHHPRSVSTSMHDLRQRPNVSKHLDVKDRSHHRTASGSHGTLAPPNVPGAMPGAMSVGGSPHTAKDTFLNYFFGGPGGPGAPGQPQSTSQASASPQHRPRQQPSSITQKEMLPDLGTGRRRGQSGVEGGSTAFDMKSLGKHLEAVSVILICTSVANAEGP